MLSYFLWRTVKKIVSFNDIYSVMLEKKLCRHVKGVRLPSRPLTATVLPQYQRQILPWWEYPAEDFSLVLFSMTNAADLVLSCLLLAPKNILWVKGHFCFSTLPFFCPPLHPLGLSSCQIVSAGHSVSFIFYPLPGLPTQCRVQPHLREPLYILVYWNRGRSVHCSQWAVDFAVLWRAVTKPWGWALWGSPFTCFQIQKLSYDFSQEPSRIQMIILSSSFSM